MGVYGVVAMGDQNPHATEENNDGLNNVVTAVPESWEQFDGLPDYSAEFKAPDKGAISIRRTEESSECEIVLHHADCPAHGRGGWRQQNYVRSTSVHGTEEAKIIIRDYVENLEEYVEQRLAEIDEE